MSATRNRNPRADRAAGAYLTARYAVIRAMAESGMTTRQIADELGVPQHTVRMVARTGMLALLHPVSAFEHRLHAAMRQHRDKLVQSGFGFLFNPASVSTFALPLASSRSSPVSFDPPRGDSAPAGLTSTPPEQGEFDFDAISVTESTTPIVTEHHDRGLQQPVS